jgi:hypothetical protein
VANPIRALAWHYARLQGTGRGVCNAPSHTVNPDSISRVS